MRILVSLPAISETMARQSKQLSDNFLEIRPFKPTARTLDVFHSEMSGVKVKDFLGINVPHWSLEQKGCSGIAGPGLPSGELFFPDSLRDKFMPLVGSYDKWRPYPAENLTNYALKMASKFARKRRKMFEKAARDMSWDMLCYVEHSPASLAHLDQEAAMRIADGIVGATLGISGSMPFVSVVIFSPYGHDGGNGFVVANHLEASRLQEWNKIREFLENANTRHRPKQL